MPMPPLPGCAASKGVGKREEQHAPQVKRSRELIYPTLKRGGEVTEGEPRGARDSLAEGYQWHPSVHIVPVVACTYRSVEIVCVCLMCMCCSGSSVDVQLSMID